MRYLQRLILRILMILGAFGIALCVGPTIAHAADGYDYTFTNGNKVHIASDGTITGNITLGQVYRDNTNPDYPSYIGFQSYGTMPDGKKIALKCYARIEYPNTHARYAYPLPGTCTFTAKPNGNGSYYVIANSNTLQGDHTYMTASEINNLLGVQRTYNANSWVPSFNATLTLQKTSSNGAITNGNDRYTFEGITYDIYSSAGVKQTTLKLNKDGKASCTLPAGKGYYAIESSTNACYKLNQQMWTFDTISSKVVLSTSDEPITAGIKIHKESSNPGISNGNGLYSLEGTVYTIYADENCATEVGSITTSASGEGELGGLAAGKYWIRETTAAPGYALDTTTYFVELNPGDTKVVNGSAVYDMPQYNPVDILIQKVDAETDEISGLGGGSLAGAEFRVTYYAGYYDSADALPTTPTRSWIFKTDEQGIARLNDTYLVSGDALYTNNENAFVLPLGTVAIQETKAPEGYLLSDTTIHLQHITSQGATETVTSFVEPSAKAPTVKDQVARGDVEWIKINDSQEPLGNVVFSITSKTTNESHIVVSDENGYVNTSSSWNAHSQNTNANDAALQDDGTIDASKLSSTSGTWFSGLAKNNEAKDDSGALPYDTYMVQELRCEANKDLNLVSFEISITRNNTVVKRGTVTDTPYDIYTEALDSVTKTHFSQAGLKSVIIDMVEVSGLKKGSEYRLVASLYDVDTACELDGVSCTKDFIAASSKDKQALSLTFNSLDYEGHSLVVFERLYQGDTLLIEEADPNIEQQTVRYATIETHASDVLSGTNEALAQESVNLQDRVDYKGLDPSLEYELKTEVLFSDGTSTGVSVTTTFAPESSEGSILVPVTLSDLDLAGKCIVFTEELIQNGNSVAVHHDLNDANQTISFPQISTSATDSITASHTSVIGSNIAITDTITYTNLLPGTTYKLEGILVDKESGDYLLDSAGNPISTSVEFIPENPEGSIEASFSIDSTRLAGHTLVVFEQLFKAEYLVASHEDIHAEEQSISVPIPSIVTTAVDSLSKGKALSAATDSVSLTDSIMYEHLCPGETYTLKGCLVDKDTGASIRDSEGNPVCSTAEFSPEGPSGTAEVEFTFNPLETSSSAVVVYEELYCNDFLITEHKELSSETQRVDLIKEIHTSAVDAADNNKTIDEAQDATILDTVELKGLVAGQTYRLSATLMDKEAKTALALNKLTAIERKDMLATITGSATTLSANTTTSKSSELSETTKAEAIDTSENYTLEENGIVTFKASASEATILIPLHVAADKISGSDLVVFETLELIKQTQDNKEDEADSAETQSKENAVVVATHEDLDDKDQTISVKKMPLETLVQTGLGGSQLFGIALSIGGLLALLVLVVIAGFSKVVKPRLTKHKYGFKLGR